MPTEAAPDFGCHSRRESAFASRCHQRSLRWGLTLSFGLLYPRTPPLAQAQHSKPACRQASLEGEVAAGQSFTRPIGSGLVLFLQPIHSGWILRVLPASGPPGQHDYAELATPPYRSVSPLSLSTDFAFRAQDAVGWNPRRFRFAASKLAFARLDAVYRRFEQAGATPPAPLQVDLSTEIAQAPEGAWTILDARLLPGSADQVPSAAAVASHFNQTAHTVVQPPNTPASPLGRLLWIRFRVDLDLPRGFLVDPRWRVLSSPCLPANLR